MKYAGRSFRITSNALLPAKMGSFNSAAVMTLPLRARDGAGWLPLLGAGLLEQEERTTTDAARKQSWARTVNLTEEKAEAKAESVSRSWSYCLLVRSTITGPPLALMPNRACASTALR